MRLKECYDAFGGDYDSVKERILKEEMIEKFLIKFLSEPSYENLCHSLEQENYEEAFRAAHSMKGVCANLGFGELEKGSSDLTEYLRGKEKDQIDKNQCQELLEKVAEDYKKVTGAIQSFMEA